MISIGAGLCALGVLPALLVSALRAFLSRDDEERAAAIPMGAPLLLALLGLAAYYLERATDSFNAWRASWPAGATGAYMAASSLGEAGRRVLRRGLLIVTLMLLVSIFLEPGLDGTLEVTVQGAIGNTGDLAEAAIPGAILGAGAFLTTGGPLALLGLLALVGTALHAGLVPVCGRRRDGRGGDRGLRGLGPRTRRRRRRGRCATREAPAGRAPRGGPRHRRASGVLRVRREPATPCPPSRRPTRRRRRRPSATRPEASPSVG